MFNLFRKPPKHYYGFFLLETVIAFTLFALFFVFFLVAYRNIYASQQRSWGRVSAALLAQDAIEVTHHVLTTTEDLSSLVQRLETGSYRYTLSPQPGLLRGDETIEEDYQRFIFIKPVTRDEETDELIRTNTNRATYQDFNTLEVRTVVRWMEKGLDQEVSYVTYVVNREAL